MPSDWPQVALGDVARIEIGGTPARDQPRFWARPPAGHAWLSIADLRGRVVSETAERISDAGVRSSNVKLIPAGTPLMSFKLTIGRTAIAGQEIYTNEAIAAFIPNAISVATEWLYYELPRAAGRGVADTAIKGATLNKAKLRRLTIALPPISEQRAIATVLVAIDHAIEAAERVIAKLEQMKQGLRRDLVSRGIDKNGLLRDGTSPTVGMVTMTIGEVSAKVPGATVIGPFGSNLVATDYRETGHPVVFVRDVKEDGFAWISQVYVSEGKARELAAHAVIPGDVIVTKMGDPPGIACLYPPGMPPGIVTADIIRIRVDTERVLPDWLVLAINAEDGHAQVRALMGGVTRSKLTLSGFRTLKVPVPSIEEQRRALRVLKHTQSRSEAEVAELEKLHCLKKGLMNDLLTGAVQVTPLDEGST